MRSLPPDCVLALADLRSFLEDCWRWSHEVHYARSFPRSDPRPSLPSTYMCRHTSRLLLELLEETDPGWTLNGGTMATKKGDTPQPHWWIEKDGVIVDLTADQFGWDAITVTSSDDPRYQALAPARGKHWIKGLTTTIQTWRGQASRDWMEQDPQFQSLAKASAQALSGFQDRWKAALSLDPSSPLAVRPSKP